MSRILVVEDEEAIAELLALNLRHAGHEVALAGDAAQAQLEVDAVLPDLVVLDWMLPDQSGLALARRWRNDSRTRSLPIIKQTAPTEETDKIAGLDSGADDYLTKPFSTSELHAHPGRAARRAPEALEQAVRAGELLVDPQRTASRWPGATCTWPHRVSPAALSDDAPGPGAQPQAIARPRVG
jgi:two-component system phosphate regulon response regulator PhoB